MAHHREQLREDALRSGLTVRETQCLVEWSEGVTMAMVGYRLCISESTVKQALARARRRLGADTNAALLVAVAYREAA